MAEGRTFRFDDLKKLHPGDPDGDGSQKPGWWSFGNNNETEPPADETTEDETTEDETTEDETTEDDQNKLPEDERKTDAGDTDEEDAYCSVCGHPLEDGNCIHQSYAGLSIALGVLSLLLIGAVVLLSIRCANLKRRRRRRKPGGKAAAAAAAAAQEQEVPVFTGVQVGKLHQIGDRESQQDCLAVSPAELYETKGILAVVADGMGGLSDGDKMSQTVAATMMNGFMANREASPELILALTAEANQAVNRVLGPANQGRSGSTLVAGIVSDGCFSYVSVGDSRICLYRQGLLTQLNREHIYRNELRVQAINGLGTLWDAGTHPKAAGLTSYLGMGNLKYVDIPAEPLRVCAGDKIVLMSDGVYNAMTLQEMEEALAQPAQQAADAIGAAIHAKAYRHQDNYTAVILQF